MRAVVITKPGPPEVLELVNVADPASPKANEVLIKVAYSGINRPDILQRKGYYPAPEGVPATIPGLEVSGTIVACGSFVKRFKVGDKVCALIAGGGYAEYVLADEGSCLPLTFAEPLDEELALQYGAAIPETVFTVWHNVFQLGNLQSNERLLVHGGSGGIGTTAIQLARLHGAEVYATARDKQRCAKCEALGANQALPYTEQDFSEVWSNATDPQGESLKMDVILDSIGGDYFRKNLDLLAVGGRLVQINSTKGRRVELDLLELMQKRFHLTGSTLRARDLSFKRSLRDAIEEQVWPWVSRREFVPVIDQILPADQVVQAHQLLESGSVFGKLLLAW